MEQQQFQCTGDCIACSNAQRQYCASQHAYNSMRMIERMEQRMTTFEEQISNISKKIEAIQNNEAMVFDPYRGAREELIEFEDIAQEGDGVL